MGPSLGKKSVSCLPGSQKKCQSGGRGFFFFFFFLVFRVLLTTLYRRLQENKTCFKKKHGKKVPVVPFKPSPAVDRKQLFI